MRYLVQERIFSITTDFWIEDENGNRVFLVDGRALSLRETFELKDAHGNVLILIRKKLFAMRDTMEIENSNGVVATVRPAFFSPLRHRYEIDLADGQRLEAVGNFTDKDWELSDGHQPGRWSHLPALVLCPGRLRGRGGAWRRRRARHRHRGVHRPDPRGRDAQEPRALSLRRRVRRSLARNSRTRARADVTPLGAGSSPAGNPSPVGNTVPASSRPWRPPSRQRGGSSVPRDG